MKNIKLMLASLTAMTVFNTASLAQDDHPETMKNDGILSVTSINRTADDKFPDSKYAVPLPDELSTCSKDNAPVSQDFVLLPSSNDVYGLVRPVLPKNLQNASWDAINKWAEKLTGAEQEKYKKMMQDKVNELFPPIETALFAELDTLWYELGRKYSKADMQEQNGTFAAELRERFQAFADKAERKQGITVEILYHDKPRAHNPLSIQIVNQAHGLQCGLE